jgi:hypothetical protein
MNDIKIRQVKLIKSGEKMEISYSESGDLNATNDKICKDPVHPDLRIAMSGLAVHLGILTDYLVEKQASDKDLIEKFVVTGYSIGGKEDQEGYNITGYRKTRRGKAVTLNSPFELFEQNPESQYILIGDLMSRIEAINKEVLLYLFEGKRGVDLQASLEFPEENITHMQVANEETQEEKDEEVLKRMRAKTTANHANPEAMERVKNWDNPNGEVETITEPVGDMIEMEREKLRGKGKGKNATRKAGK